MNLGHIDNKTKRRSIRGVACATLYIHSPRGTPHGPEKGDKGMPESRISRKKNPFYALCRQEPLTATEWVEVIEFYRSLISPLFSRFTLSQLKDLECIRDATDNRAFSVNLGQSNKRPGDEIVAGGHLGASTTEVLSTQGIFGTQSFDQVFAKDAQHFGWYEVNIWGLTRSDKWVQGRVRIEKRFEGFERDKPPRTWRYRVLSFSAYYCESEGLFGENGIFPPWQILRGLIEFLDGLKRRRVYEIAMLDEVLKWYNPVREILLHANPKCRMIL